MKRDKFLTFTVGFLIAELLAWGAMGCMISGLSLPVENWAALYLTWAVCSLAGCVLFSFKYGGVAALAGATAVLVYLWSAGGLTVPIRALITRLSIIYDGAYRWGVLEFAGVNWETTSLDPLLAVLGGLIALTAAGAMLRRRGSTGAVLMSLLPLVSTMVVTNTVPASRYLFALICAVALILLTGSVRRQNPHQGARLTALTALPVILVCALLFQACPQSGYVNHSEEQLDSIVSWFQARMDSAWSGGGQLGQYIGGTSTAATTRLSSLGPRSTWTYPVMEVTAANGGTIYLRGQDYDTYTGSSWSASGDREEEFTDPALSVYDGSITIRTLSTTDVLYLPYYPAGGMTLSGGRVDNGENHTEYSYSLSAPVSYYTGWATEDLPIYTSFDLPEYALDDLVSRTYLALPEDTSLWAEDYVNQILSSSGIYDNHFAPANANLAAVIADHVRSSALYDTGTGRMSGNYDDFVQWFLEDSDTGYCVHFATATAVLLRAAGVPARYVTGYMFSAEAGQTTTVTADQAHAWVEYYEPILGTWVVLESTPADLSQEETTPPTEETQAPTDPLPSGEAPTPPQDQTRPIGSDIPDTPEAPRLDLSRLWAAVKWLLWAALTILTVIGQRLVRLTLRRRRVHHGSPNTRALARWQEVERHCRIRKLEPPEGLLDLAQKAKFSQHQLTKEELGAFDAWLRDSRAEMHKRPWYWKLFCQYVLALW